MGVFESSDSVSLGVVDLATGELVAEQIQFTKKGARFIMPSGFAVASNDLFNRLGELSLPADGYRLLLKIMAASPYGGHVHKANEEYAEEMGVQKTRISALIRKLHDAGIVHRIGPQTVFINPGYFFRGRPEQQHQALEEWMRLRTPNIKTFGKKKKA